MLILFLTNNSDVAGPLIQWLRNDQAESVIQTDEKISSDTILSLNPEFLISYNYKYIINKSVLDLMSNKIINLHISYLPWNRGADPNVWSFLQKTPKGVSIHLIDEGLDTGNILLQDRVYFQEDKETLSSTYSKLHSTIQELFKNNWAKIKNLEIDGKPQVGCGSFHRVNDFRNMQDSILGSDGWDISIPELKKRYKLLGKDGE